MLHIRGAHIGTASRADFTFFLGFVPKRKRVPFLRLTSRSYTSSDAAVSATQKNRDFTRPATRYCTT
ncbi:MAG: hypothetical protein H8E35_04375 [Ardenticatenia bacterium]|nr:hypothetical protein [Ardenticatenia bacterium]